MDGGEEKEGREGRMSLRGGKERRWREVPQACKIAAPSIKRPEWKKKKGVGVWRE